MAHKIIQVSIEVKDKQERTAQFARDTFTFGTEPTNDILLDDGVGVPRKVVVSLNNEGLSLDLADEGQSTDSESGEPTKVSSSVKSGDSLKLGNNTVLTFEITDPPIETEVPPETPLPRQARAHLPFEDDDIDEFDRFANHDPFSIDVTADVQKPMGTEQVKISLPTPPNSSQRQTRETPAVEKGVQIGNAKLSLVKTRDRAYCVGCLELLDPGDRREEYRQIVQCSRCGALYHEKTWSNLRVCVRCDNKQANKVQIAAPTQLVIQRKLTAIPPKTRVYRPQTEALKPPTSGEPIFLQKTAQSLKNFLVVAGLSLRDSVILIVMVALITAISVYFMRIVVDLPFGSRTNFQAILDAVLRSPVPTLDYFVIGATFALSVALVLFPHALYNKIGDPSIARRLMRLAALTILSVLVGSIELRLYMLNPQDITYSIQLQQPLIERIAYICLAAGTLTLLATPIYRTLTHRTNALSQNPEEASAGWRVISTVRFFAILLALFIAVYLTMITPLARQWIVNFTVDQGQEIGSENLYLVFGISLAGVAALALYFPPSYKAFRRRLLLLRVIGVVGLLALAVFVYRSTDAASSLLAAAAIAMVGIIVLLPVQRAFS